MNELQHKYRHDSLSPDELKQLREDVNSMNDTEMERQMRDAWMNDDIDTSNVDPDRLSAIKRSVMSHCSGRKSLVRTLLRVAAIAAIIIIPLLGVSTFYFYQRSENMAEQSLLFSTGIGESATITLPDGTNVQLNANSRLSYSPKNYGKTQRTINFDGEGYFKVAKNRNSPFVINAAGLDVTVLGTKFNLSARTKDPTATVYLADGCVKFTSTLTNDYAILKPGETAVMNRSNGNITVTHDEDAERIHTAWMSHEMVLCNCSFKDMLNKIDNTYGVKLKTNYVPKSTDLFTGTLPTNNLHDAITIIETAYHVKINK
jgi:transmembrane sensor